jgi:RNA polymerase-binding transcription factor DksA
MPQNPSTEQDAGDDRWTDAEMAHFEKRLMDERKRAVAQVAEFDDTLGVSEEEATGELSTWRFHMADVGTETFEREQNFLLASREGQLLWHIDQALRRLYANPASFGKCSECGKKIAYERLDAIPYVPRCVSCKQDWESSAPSPDAEARP